ncbi:hypothetical protein QUF64_10090 [Anaerolineales bacterium HSG6]|nr:hypothetical protein [Anaerolineales bacterium HSG6]MDM8531379.1 hypothetical protein [Anaerolineales bacterium HSG25]
MIDDLRQQGMAQDISLYHQRLSFSGGSVIDVVFEQLYMQS